MSFNSTSTGVKIGEGTAYLSRESEFTSGSGGIVWLSFSSIDEFWLPSLWYRQTSSTVLEKVNDTYVWDPSNVIKLWKVKVIYSSLKVNGTFSEISQMLSNI